MTTLMTAAARGTLRRGRAASGWRPALRALAAGGFLAVAELPAAPCAGAQAAGDERPPFFVGEALEYRVTVARFGSVGRVTMRVDSTPPVHGTEAVLLRFAFDARVGLVRATDRTESWLDPVRMRALRFHKHERHPLSRHDERVELDPDARRWTDAAGVRGTSSTDAPLDELSFMYFVRTLPLVDGGAWEFDRHYDPARSPTRVRVVGRGTVATDVGTFRTVSVELTVRDPRRYKGDGVIRLDLTDDRCRLPVRIESRMPVIGRTVMLLAAQNHPASHHLAREP